MVERPWVNRIEEADLVLSCKLEELRKIPVVKVCTRNETAMHKEIECPVITSLFGLKKKKKKLPLRICNP